MTVFPSQKTSRMKSILDLQNLRQSLLLQTWQRVFAKLWIRGYTSQVRSLPKRSVNASHKITYHMLFNGSYTVIKKNRLFLLLTYTEQQGQIFLTLHRATFLQRQFLLPSGQTFSSELLKSEWQSPLL